MWKQLLVRRNEREISVTTEFQTNRSLKNFQEISCKIYCPVIYDFFFVCTSGNCGMLVAKEESSGDYEEMNEATDAYINMSETIMAVTEITWYDYT